MRAGADRIEHAVVDVTDEAAVRDLFEEIGALDHLFVTATPPAASGAFIEQGSRSMSKCQSRRTLRTSLRFRHAGAIPLLA